jgi:hypothetical protein
MLHDVALVTAADPILTPSRYSRTVPVKALGKVPEMVLSLAVYEPVMEGQTVVAAKAVAAVDALLMAQLPFCCVAV